MRPDTNSEVVDSILHAAHRVRVAADANLREEGLSLSSYKLLKALATIDRSMREVSEILHVSPRTVTDIIDGLEARDLVTRCSHASDRRVTMLHLSEAGARVLRDARRGVEQATEAAIRDLDDDEQRTLRLLLDRVSPRPAGLECPPPDPAASARVSVRAGQEQPSS